MDKEVQERMIRIVGSLQTLELSAKSISVMPCDKRTNDLLDSAKVILSKAVISAWEYADSASDSCKL